MHAAGAKVRYDARMTKQASETTLPQYAVATPSFFLFFRWYYGHAWEMVLRVYGRMILWAEHRFGIGHHLATLISPWHRDITQRKRGFSFEEFFGVLGMNLISRLIGFIIRSFMIVIGFILMAVIFLVGLILVVLYLFLPWIAFGALVIGTVSLIQGIPFGRTV